MHAYLESIGFSNIRTRHSMDLLNEDVVAHFDDKVVFRNEDGRLMGEYSRDYAHRAGLTVCGEIDDENKFHPEFSYPYFKGDNVSTREEVNVERHAGKDSYAGACDDSRIGITIIFYLINTGEYRILCGRNAVGTGKKAVLLSALAKEGTILLPIHKDRELERISRKTNAARSRLVDKARDGDEDAMESLTMDDIDTYSMISQRLGSEDVLSIVDSYFMPYGMECDQYSILGLIRSVETVRNTVTDEKLYQLEVECNDMTLAVCINAGKLMGEPYPGRRFKGLVWLQGYVHFDS